MKITQQPDWAGGSLPEGTFLVIAAPDPDTSVYKNYKIPPFDPTLGSSVHDDIEFIVGVDSGPISGIPAGVPSAGTSTITLDSSITRVRVIRNHIPQSYKNDGGTYFTYNSSTHELTFFGALQGDDIIQIHPY